MLTVIDKAVLERDTVALKILLFHWTDVFLHLRYLQSVSEHGAIGWSNLGPGRKITPLTSVAREIQKRIQNLMEIYIDQAIADPHQNLVSMHVRIW